MTGHRSDATLLSPASWCTPPRIPVLESDEVHVWRAALEPTVSCVESLQQTLSADEQARADRFYFARDQQRFIIARGLLRIILSRYLGTEPGELRFCYNAHGKPALAPECVGDPLHFNLSHSHEHVLYAITRDRQLGIDLERVRADLADREIAERYFSPREVAALDALSPELQRTAFFDCWTRKEAYIKAKGQGLLISLNQFDVSLAPGEPAALLSTQWDSQEARRWSLRALTPGPGYAAALAVEGHHWQLRCWHWSW